MNKKIKDTLDLVEVDGEKLEHGYIRYIGDKKTYVTWHIISDIPALWWSDDDKYSIVEIDIHIFSDTNYKKIEKEIIKKFKENGFVYKGSEQELYEEDTKLYHKIINFEIEKGGTWLEQV